MIKFALQCGDCDHGFEAWFASGDAYDKQQSAGLVECPNCMGQNVGKQIMAPSLKGTRKKTSDSPEAMFRKFASAARKHIAENCDYVGGEFANEARAMHYGDIDARPIWGEVTADERKAL
ncbi:MAG: DUF1178 family protein, partial [Pseudomonadota bacterium]